MVNEDRARRNGLKAAKTVRDVLTKVGWEPEETEEEAVLRIDFSKDGIPVHDALAKVRVDLERFIFLLNLRGAATARHRAETMEFVTRANYGLVIGAFEMDLDTGKVRFRSSVDFTQAVLSESLVRNAVLSAMDVVEHYGELLEEVMHGKKTANQAYEEAAG